MPVNFTIPMESGEYEAIRDVAKSQERSMAAVGRIALRDYVNRATSPNSTLPSGGTGTSEGGNVDKADDITRPLPSGESPTSAP